MLIIWQECPRRPASVEWELRPQIDTERWSVSMIKVADIAGRWDDEMYTLLTWSADEICDCARTVNSHCSFSPNMTCKNTVSACFCIENFHIRSIYCTEITLLHKYMHLYANHKHLLITMEWLTLDGFGFPLWSGEWLIYQDSTKHHKSIMQSFGLFKLTSMRGWQSIKHPPIWCRCSGAL